MKNANIAKATSLVLALTLSSFVPAFAQETSEMKEAVASKSPEQKLPSYDTAMHCAAVYSNVSILFEVDKAGMRRLEESWFQLASKIDGKDGLLAMVEFAPKIEEFYNKQSSLKTKPAERSEFLSSNFKKCSALTNQYNAELVDAYFEKQLESAE